VIVPVMTAAILLPGWLRCLRNMVSDRRLLDHLLLIFHESVLQPCKLWVEQFIPLIENEFATSQFSSPDKEEPVRLFDDFACPGIG
jgi:hypothetical protein